MHNRRASEVKIHLKGAALRRAKIDSFRRGLLTLRGALKFTGPEFKEDAHSCLSVAIGAGTVNVTVNLPGAGSAIEYVYPLDTVGRIRIINKF